MCLILLAWKLKQDPLIVAANRDEFHARPAAPAAFWEDKPDILAGRDLEARGTWMGVSRSGRFAAVTNYRGAREARAAETRGALVSRFLENGVSPEEYLGDLLPRLNSYSGFNLLLSDGIELWSISNRGGEPRRLEPGIYGLGNTLLDAPEVEPSKQRFADTIAAGTAVEPLFSVLAQARIVNPTYGTRCSTVFFGRRYAERSFSSLIRRQRAGDRSVSVLVFHRRLWVKGDDACSGEGCRRPCTRRPPPRSRARDRTPPRAPARRARLLRGHACALPPSACSGSNRRCRVAGTA
jgi:uncharacterized protein with NRDE domain